MIVLVVAIAVGCWYFGGCFGQSARQEAHVVVVPQTYHQPAPRVEPIKI